MNFINPFLDSFEDLRYSFLSFDKNAGAIFFDKKKIGVTYIIYNVGGQDNVPQLQGNGPAPVCAILSRIKCD